MIKRALESIVIVGLAFTSTITFAAKTDVVQLVNGDEITGEIKSLNFGALSYSTDSMGTVSIDWEDIVSIRTVQPLQVEITDGTRYFGPLRKTEASFQVLVVGQSTVTALATSDIIRLTQVETDETFISALDGSISLGFDTQKASSVTTLNLASDVEYRTLRYLAGLTVNASITEQPGQERSQRSQVGINYQRFRPDRWFTAWFGSWETNQQLGIDNRYIVGAGVGRYLIQTNRNQFSATVGINGTREVYVGVDESETVPEGRVQLRYLHRSLKPESHVSLTTNIYPLLPDFSSFRSETDLSFRREFIDDLFFDVTFYHSYASDPPTDAQQEDYGLTTSIGYSW
jgi:putative salt-induced outer membrane protein YdiY